MPRMPYSAREKIIKSLREGSKNWSNLLKDTKLSKAALSTSIRNLIQELVIVTDIDTSKRPPVTVYKINPMAFSFRNAKPVYSIREEEPKILREKSFQLIGKWVLKDPKKLDQLLRLHAIREICDHASETFAVISTDYDVDPESLELLESLELDERPFESKEDVQDFCIERIVRSIKHVFESWYDIKVPGHKIKEEIEKIRQEGFFDFGLKHHYGVKVTKKLAKLYDKWDEEILNFYDKVEKEVKEKSGIAINL